MAIDHINEPEVLMCSWTAGRFLLCTDSANIIRFIWASYEQNVKDMIGLYGASGLNPEL